MRYIKGESRWHIVDEIKSEESFRAWSLCGKLHVHKCFIYKTILGKTELCKLCEAKREKQEKVTPDAD